MFESHARNLTSHATGTWGQTYVRDLTGRCSVMVAKVGKRPKKVKAGERIKVKTSGIAAGQKVTVTWKAKGGTAVKRTIKKVVVVKKNRITTKAGPKRGTYAVVVDYDGRTLRTQTVRTG